MDVVRKGLTVAQFHEESAGHIIEGDTIRSYVLPSILLTGSHLVVSLVELWRAWQLELCRSS